MDAAASSAQDGLSVVQRYLQHILNHVQAQLDDSGSCI